MKTLIRLYVGRRTSEKGGGLSSERDVKGFLKIFLPDGASQRHLGAR